MLVTIYGRPTPINDTSIGVSMTAAQYARSKGYTLKAIAARCYQPVRTISRWHKTKPYVFELLIDGLILQDALKKVSG